MLRQGLHAGIAELAQVLLDPWYVVAVTRMHLFLAFRWHNCVQHTLVALWKDWWRGLRCTTFCSSWAFRLAFSSFRFCVCDHRGQPAALPFERDVLVQQTCRHLQVRFFNGVEQIAQLATASVFVYTSMKMTQLARGSYIVYTRIKGNWATNEMLIIAGFCKQFLKLIVDTVRRQNLAG